MEKTQLIQNFTLDGLKFNALHIRSLLCFSFPLEEGTDHITCRKKAAKLARVSLRCVFKSHLSGSTGSI